MAFYVARGPSISSLLSKGVTSQKFILNGSFSKIKNFSGSKTTHRFQKASISSTRLLKAEAKQPSSKAPAENVSVAPPSKEEADAILSQLTVRLGGKIGKATNQLLVNAVHQKIQNNVEKDAQWLLNVLKQDHELKLQLLDRSQPREPLITELYNQGKLQLLTAQFLVYLDQNKLMKYVTKIFEDYIKLVRDYRKEIEIEIVVADEESLKDTNLIAEEIRQGFYPGASTVKSNVKIDPTILGGFTLRFGDNAIDSSLKSQLEERDRQVEAWLSTLSPSATEKYDPKSNPYYEDIQKLNQKIPKLLDKNISVEEYNAIYNQLNDFIIADQNYNAFNDGSVTHNVMDQVRRNVLELLKENEKEPNFLEKVEKQFRAKFPKPKSKDVREDDNIPKGVDPSQYNEQDPGDLRKAFFSKHDPRFALAVETSDFVDIIGSRVEANPVVDEWLYIGKISNWKHIVSELKDGLEKQSYVKTIQLFEDKVAPVPFSPPKSENEYPFETMRKMPVKELINLPVEEFSKLSAQEFEQLPLNELKAALSENLGLQPIHYEEIRKLDLSKVKPVDIDVILMDINDQLRINLKAKEYAVELYNKEKNKDLNVKETAKLPIAEMKKLGITVNSTLDDEIKELWKLKKEVEAKVAALGLQPLPDRLDVI